MFGAKRAGHGTIRCLFFSDCIYCSAMLQQLSNWGAAYKACHLHQQRREVCRLAKPCKEMQTYGIRSMTRPFIGVLSPMGAFCLEINNP